MSRHATANPWEKQSREFFLPAEALTASYERAPVAVPLDTEVPVARGFRRLHARGV